jgi:hypothetical protein
VQEVAISSIELSDLQGQIAALADDLTLDATDDPIVAAEAVARGIILRQRKGKELALPSCHSLAPDPMGFDPKARECLACFDKLTCLVSLHRLEKERPIVRSGSATYHPDSDTMIAARVPIFDDITESDRLDGLNKKQLQEMCSAMGLSKQGTVDEMADRIRAARGEFQAKPDAVLVDPGGVIDVDAIGESLQKQGVKIVIEEPKPEPEPEPPPKKKGKKVKADWGAKYGWPVGTTLRPKGKQLEKAGYAKMVDGGVTVYLADGSEVFTSSPRKAATVLWESVGLTLPRGKSGRDCWDPLF